MLAVISSEHKISQLISLISLSFFSHSPASRVCRKPSSSFPRLLLSVLSGGPPLPSLPAQPLCSQQPPSHQWGKPCFESRPPAPPPWGTVQPRVCPPGRQTGAQGTATAFPPKSERTLGLQGHVLAFSRSSKWLSPHSPPASSASLQPVLTHFGDFAVH